jgi:hypothetical protein
VARYSEGFIRIEDAYNGTKNGTKGQSKDKNREREDTHPSTSGDKESKESYVGRKSPDSICPSWYVENMSKSR